MPAAVVDGKLISALYGAALYENDWFPALDRLRELLNSRDAVLSVWIPKGSQAKLLTTGNGLTAALGESYEAYYGHVDPKRPILDACEPGFIFNDADYFDEDFVARNVFYQEFSRAAGTRHTLDMLVKRDHTCEIYLAAMRCPAAGHYDREAMDLLRVASEHFLRTLALKEKFDQVSLVGAALDQLSHGLAICDATARVLFANAAAREVIDAEDRLRLRQGQLCSDSPALTAKLHSMIVTAARREGVAGRVTIRGRNGRPFALWCAPLSETSPLSNGRSRTAVVVIVPDLAGERSDPKELTILFDLTPTEAKLALALTRGETLRIYAATNGVQFSTARTQLLSVLRKTGLRRQADLIRTLSSLASPLLQNNSDKSAAK